MVLNNKNVVVIDHTYLTPSDLKDLFIKATKVERALVILKFSTLHSKLPYRVFKAVLGMSYSLTRTWLYPAVRVNPGEDLGSREVSKLIINEK